MDTPVVAEAVSGADGYFVATISDPTILAQTVGAALANGGLANFELRIHAGALYYTTFYSLGAASPGGTAATPSRWVEGMSRQPLAVRWVRLADGVGGVTRLAPGVRGAVAEMRAGETPERERPGSFRALPPCLQWFKTQDLTEQFGVVGEMHRWGDVIRRGKFTYGRIADSTFGIGWSSNSGSTWSVNGSAYVGNTAGSSGWTDVTSRQTSTGHMAEAKFKRAEFAQACTTNLKRQATEWNGLDVRRGGAVSGFDGKCNTTYAQYAHKFPDNQGGWTRESGQATSWGAGISLGPITVWGRSGFSTHAKTEFFFTSSLSNKKILCGNNGDIRGVSTRVFAGVS